MNRLALCLGLAVATTAGALPTNAAPADAGPINVKQCFVLPPKALSSKPKGTQIDDVNVTRKRRPA